MVRASLLFLVLLASLATANATPILAGSTTDPLGIQNLPAGSSSYNVFLSKQSDDSRSAKAELFDFDRDAKSHRRLPLWGDRTSCGGVVCSVAVEKDWSPFASPNVWRESQRPEPISAPSSTLGPNCESADECFGYFKPENVRTVPEPQMIWLLVTGLGALLILKGVHASKHRLRDQNFKR